jgi:acyl carrier protein
MKNAMASRAMDVPSKDQAIETIIEIFVREIGFVDREAVSRTTHVVRDFQIDTDDLSWFSAAVIKHFGISVTPKDWLGVEPTIEGIADFVLRHLSRNP